MLLSLWLAEILTNCQVFKGIASRGLEKVRMLYPVMAAQQRRKLIYARPK